MATAKVGTSIAEAQLPSGSDYVPGAGAGGSTIPANQAITTDTSQPNPATVNATPTTNPPTAPASPPVPTGQVQGTLPGQTTPTTFTSADVMKQYGASPIQKALDATKAAGTPPPQDAGAAASTVSSAIKGNTPPDTTSIDAQLAEDKGYQKLLADQTEYEHTINQTKSLTDTYNEMVKSSGLEAINTELINAKAIIEGSEEDIRNEVRAASGFASESQVMALASARNKSLIKNYNKLVDQQSNLTSQVNNMVNLAGQDRNFALQSVSQKLQIDKQLSDYRDKFVSNAKEAYANVVNAVGYKGLLESLQNSGDPNAISLAERTLGFAPGQLQQVVNTQQSQTNLKNLADYNVTTPYIITASGEVQNTQTGQAYSDPTQFQKETGMTLDQAGQKGLIKPLGLNKKDTQEQFKNQVDLAQLDLQQQGVNISKQNAAISSANLGLAREKFQYDQLKDVLDAGKLDDATIGKIQASPDYKTISGLLPAVQAIKTYKDLIQKEGTFAIGGSAKGNLESAYGNAIAAWKTLAGLGALSGADFGLAENAIPSLGLFKSNSKATAKLQSSLDNAVQQAETLTKRLTGLYPKGNEILQAQLDDLLVTAHPEKYKVGPDGKVYELTK